jgi:hypothetical protein
MDPSMLDPLTAERRDRPRRNQRRSGPGDDPIGPALNRDGLPLSLVEAMDWNEGWFRASQDCSSRCVTGKRTGMDQALAIADHDRFTRRRDRG